MRPFRDTRPLLQEVALPCRSGLVSRWAAKQPRQSQARPGSITITSLPDTWLVSSSAYAAWANSTG
ncbi:hypothetical protein DBB42_19275 [Pseudomonas plecoglossicida]|uniref:Uncharacterized protein n=1 Tax=Pseudomonas plecoglossicida TaxID=70775 RepID=A0A2R7UIY8_PSEDL|nr:hypothetical protein DBB42_19275 [Pseudomonas plecoglossicida]